MKRGRFSEEQIVKILQEQDHGHKVGDICRRHGVGEATFYKWAIFAHPPKSVNSSKRKLSISIKRVHQNGHYYERVFPTLQFTYSL